MDLNQTHDPSLRSWVASANAPDTDFPVQNLPLGVFRRADGAEPLRGGVAIGDQVLDLAALRASGCLDGLAERAAAACGGPVLNELLAMGPPAWRALRHRLSALLSHSASAGEMERIRPCLVPQSQVVHAVPMNVGDYTDFYTSIDHAFNVGRKVRPQSPLTANFQWMPIGYHGRSSSICISGQSVRRPAGQRAGPLRPAFGPCQRLDYELELGVYVGTGTRQGQPVALADAEQHLFGVSLLNDWSARDIQFWETAPLGPFLGKNFATSVSPWIVSMEALAPYRLPWRRKAEDPQPLSYLESPGNRAHGALDIQLEVWLQTAEGARSAKQPTRLSRTNFHHQYWTVAQMLAHHTVGGCNLRPGDLFGTGTISGPAPEELGCLMELTEGGSRELRLATGESRSFLRDGDQVIFKGWCERERYARIGFGQCTGTITAALSCEEQA